jgi:hypothetical protein
MASINIKTNITQVNDLLQSRLKAIGNPETFLRPLCFDLIDLMTKRIHGDGIKADGAPIGTYAKGYLKTRQKKYNRTADSKIIVSLTRQLENNWSVIATPKGFGIGFINPFNLQKARWVEDGASSHTVKDHTRNMGGKTVKVKSHTNKGWIGKGAIFSLSAAERDYAISFINDKTAETLNG